MTYPTLRLKNPELGWGLLALLGGICAFCLLSCGQKPASGGKCPKAEGGGSVELKPPTSPPDCAKACDYFVHCQSARWTGPDEVAELRGRCLKDCGEAKPKSQEDVFFAGLKKCSVNKACVPFGVCMREVIGELRKMAGGGEPEEDPSAIYKVPVGTSPVRGAADAPVTLVMYADYQCPYCVDSYATVKQLLTAYGAKLRLVYKHFPLPSHTDARVGAVAAVCVRKLKGDAAFWQFHDKVFEGKDLSAVALLEQAKAAGVGPEQIKPCMESQEAAVVVATELQQGSALGVDGTPAFFVNGKKLAGAQSLAGFKKAIDEGLARAEAAIKGGVKPADVYEHLTKDGATKPKYLKGREPAGGQQDGPPELDPTAIFYVPVSRNHPTLGPADALVTIVEFADFQCPACAFAGQRMKQLLKDFPKEVRLVFRNTPLDMHPDAALAAEAALAARAQKGDAGFFAFHDELFQRTADLSRPVLEKIAEAQGLDLPRFRKALDDRTFKAAVEQDRALAQKLGLPGTPAFYVNGRVMMGVPKTYEDLKARIDAEIAAARKRVQGGVAPKDLYDAIIKDGKTQAVYLKAGEEPPRGKGGQEPPAAPQPPQP